MKFECYFCGKNFEYTESVDIEYEQKHKYHVCADCYIKGINVILEGQYDEIVSRRKENLTFKHVYKCKNYTGDEYCRCCEGKTQEVSYPCFKK